MPLKNGDLLPRKWRSNWSFGGGGSLEFIWDVLGSVFAHVGNMSDF